MRFLNPQLVHAIKARRPSFYIPVLLFVLAICTGTLFVLANRPIPFSSSAWKHHEGVRPRMVSDLLARHDLHGLSRTAIDEMLGVPSGRDSTDDNRYTYWAGTALMDDWWIEIDFVDGRVSNVRHIPD